VSDGLVDQAEQLGQRRRRRLDEVEQLAELLDRLEEALGQQNESHDGADRKPTFVDEPASDADRNRSGCGACELDDRQVPSGDLHRLHVGVVQLLVRFGELAGLHVFPGEGLHDAHTADALLQGRKR